jgi:hypothetical protein
MKNIAPWLLVVIALLAVPALKPQGGNKPLEKPKNQKAEAPVPPYEEASCQPAGNQAEPARCEPLRVLRDFFGLEPGLSLSSEASLKAILDAAAPAAANYQLQFLVALVPDPLDSQSPLSFDLAMDAIQKGFGQVGYLPDRFWLPWKVEPPKAVGTAEPQYRTTPGVLLFRKPADGESSRSSRLAIVFLVGESPKIGIQKEAFRAALQMAANFQRGLSNPEVGILGPSFSGTVDSLLVVLRQWRTGELTQAKAAKSASQAASPLSIRIATGSATSSGLEKRLQGFDFCRTVIPDSALQGEGLRFLQEEMGWDPDQAAILSEFDTEYGQRLAGPNLSEEKSKGLFLIRFPSHISDVRNAWKQDRKDSQAEQRKVKVGNTQILAGRPALDLSLEDHDKAVDVIPSFSALSTPAKDLELSNVLETISREGIRYVGVQATDLKDRLFLIEKIRQSAPDTVVFTFDNNILLAHPDYGVVMDGVIVLSSAPLFTEGASWLPRSTIVGGRQRQQFIAEIQQGMFEAVRYLMRSQVRLRPQAWISAVGNGSLWPLAHLDVPQDSARFCGAALPRRSTLPLSEREVGLSDKSNLQILLFAGVLCALSTVLGRVGLLEGRSHGAPVSIPVNRVLITLGAVLLALSAAVLLIVGWLPEWAPLLSGDWKWTAWGPLKVSYLLLLVLAYGYLAVRLAWMACSRVGRKGTLWLLGFGSALIPLGLVPLLIVLWMPGREIELFQLRARALGSGLSPLVSLSLLMGALFVWILCELDRQSLVQIQASDCPLHALNERAVEGCSLTARKIQPWLKKTFPLQRGLLAVLAGVFVPPTFLLWRTIQPIAETKAYGRIFLALLIIASFLAVFSFIRFIVIWMGLRPILRCLNYASPGLKKTFEDLSGEIEWKPMRSFAFRMPRLKMLVLSVEKLEALIGTGKVQDPGLDDLLKRIFRNNARGLTWAERQNRRRLESVFREASVQLEPMARIPSVREFLALRVVAYLRYLFGHLRSSLIGAIGTGFLVLLAVTSYFFEPKQFVSLVIWATLAVAVAATFWIFLQMDRDPTLSRIGGTAVGKITFDKTFFTNLSLYVIVPALGVIATQFPEIGRLLGRMADQLLRVAGGG